MIDILVTFYCVVFGVGVGVIFAIARKSLPVVLEYERRRFDAAVHRAVTPFPPAISPPKSVQVEAPPLPEPIERVVVEHEKKERYVIERY
jgi:hypothetical protein